MMFSDVGVFLGQGIDPLSSSNGEQIDQLVIQLPQASKLRVVVQWTRDGMASKGGQPFLPACRAWKPHNQLKMQLQQSTASSGCQR